MRYADDQSCFQFGWLQNVADGGGRHSRLCLHNTKLHCGRKLHPQRAAFVKIDFDFGICDEIVDCVAENFLTEMDLFVILGIHEIVIGSVLVEILHLALIQHRPLDAIFRTKPVIDNRSGAELAQFGLYHSSPVPRRDVLVIHHLVKLAIHQNRVPTAQLCCLNHYRQAPVVR